MLVPLIAGGSPWLNFAVLRRVDAWIDYVVEVEAETATEAPRSAYQLSERLHWSCVGSEELWSARFAVLDEDGSEVPDTVITRG